MHGVMFLQDLAVVMIVAALGIVINGVTARLFFGGHKHDLNIRGAFLHMTADAAVSGGVVVAVSTLTWVSAGDNVTPVGPQAVREGPD